MSKSIKTTISEPGTIELLERYRKALGSDYAGVIGLAGRKMLPELKE